MKIFRVTEIHWFTARTASMKEFVIQFLFHSYLDNGTVPMAIQFREKRSWWLWPMWRRFWFDCNTSTPFNVKLSCLILWWIHQVPLIEVLVQHHLWKSVDARLDIQVSPPPHTIYIWWFRYHYIKICSIQGLSCETCAVGHTRQESGAWLGRCVRNEEPCPAGTYGDPYRKIACKVSQTTQLNQFKSLKTIHCALFSSHVHAHWPIVEISLPEPVTWVQTVMRCATVIAATPDAVVRNVPKDLLVIHWLPVVRVSLIEHQMPIVIHAEHCANTRTAVANVKSIRLAPVVIAAKSNHSSWVQNGARDASNASVWAWAKIVRAAHCIATKSEPHLCPTTMISVWLLTTKVHKSLTSKLRPTAKRCRSRE